MRLAATVIVTGIPGVGKTTVLRELEALAKAAGLKLRVVTFGTVLTELLRMSGRETDRDKIRAENIGLQKKIQVEAAAEISKMKGNGILIVDTHMFVKTTTGLWAGLPENVLRKLAPDLLVLLEAPSEEVARRRTMDTSRTRDSVPPGEVEFDVAWSRSTASACSVLTGAPVKIIRNEPGRQVQAAKELLQTIVGKLGG